jgi:glycosyltransferase involved in cell wall biosynthesis
MNLSIIIPCYNEFNSIETVLTRIQKHAPEAEVIIIDDGSNDGTKSWLEDNLTKYNYTLLVQEKNSGKGSCLQRGFKKATKDIIIIQDADLEYDPADYKKLIQPILDGKADVVYGSRFKGEQAQRALYFWNYVANKFLTFLSNLFNNLNLTDMETCYKVFRRECIQSLTLHEKRFGIEPEITAKIAKKRYRIYEVGISYEGRRFEEGKKIGIKDGFWAIWCIVRYGIFS